MNHPHGCPNCIHIGTDRPRGPSEMSAKSVDLYICKGSLGFTLIRRWSGTSFQSLLASYADGPRWEMVRNAAYRHGYVPERPQRYEVLVGSD